MLPHFSSGHESRFSDIYQLQQTSEFSLFFAVTTDIYIFQQVFPCGCESENVAEKRNRLNARKVVVVAVVVRQMSKSKSRNKVDL